MNCLVRLGQIQIWFRRRGEGLLSAGAPSAHCYATANGGAARPTAAWPPAPTAQVDNAFMDLDEPPNESVQGWKGPTALANYEIAKIPMSLELTRVNYNYNWQATADRSAFVELLNLNNDRCTNIAVFNPNMRVPVAGGIELVRS